MQASTAHFDSRVFNVGNPLEAYENFCWRVMDCRRNSKSLLGRKYLSQKEMNNISSNEVTEILLKRFNVDWDQLPGHYKTGSVVKHSFAMKKTFVPYESMGFIICMRGNSR